MPEEEKKEPRHSEVTFLPPLQMVLSFFDKKTRQRAQKKQEVQKQKEKDEKVVEKLIEKLSEKNTDE
jgi:hypothetical protein